MKAKHTLAVLATVLLATACGQAQDPVTPEAGARLDGIITIGSGNREDTTTTASTTESTTVQTRGIVTMGSGN